MYKYILEGAGDINWMALFALLTFFAVFVVAIIAIFGSSKSYIEKMSSLPLHDSYSDNPLNESENAQ